VWQHEREKGRYKNQRRRARIWERVNEGEPAMYIGNCWMVATTGQSFL